MIGNKNIIGGTGTLNYGVPPIAQSRYRIVKNGSNEAYLLLTAHPLAMTSQATYVYIRPCLV
jgi:hypothetical protein